MSEEMNAPMLPPPSGVSAWLSTWRDAITKPNEQTFAAIASSPNAKSATAFLWIFITSLIQGLLTSFVQGPFLRQFLEQQGLGANLPIRGIGSTIVSAICGAPIGAVISVVFFAIGAGIIQWIARMFGGRGTFDQLAYAMAAIAAPFALIFTVLTLLIAIPVPFVGLCFGVVGLIALVYVLVLDVMAVKGVNQIGWGQAVGSVLIPLLAVLLICCCLTIGAAFAFRGLFNQLRQGLGQ